MGTGPCAGEEMEVKLPSGKIDLNPQGGFEVVAGEALAIELDLDLDKSIKLKEAGKSGKCIFRPVIFVDIYNQPVFMPTCPRIISGTIETLRYNTEEDVIGFEMLMANGNDDNKTVTVLTEFAAIIDGWGKDVAPDALQPGDIVNVRGTVEQSKVNWMQPW